MEKSGDHVRCWNPFRITTPPDCYIYAFESIKFFKFNKPTKEYLSGRNTFYEGGLQSKHSMGRIKMQTFTAVLHKEEDMYVAECPEVGTVSQGETIEEAIANLKEATELYLDEFPLKEKERKTLMTTFECQNLGKFQEKK